MVVKMTEQVAQDARDLGMLRVDKYAEVLEEIYKKLLPLMKPKAHSIINVYDIWKNEV